MANIRVKYIMTNIQLQRLAQLDKELNLNKNISDEERIKKLSGQPKCRGNGRGKKKVLSSSMPGSSRAKKT